MNNDVLSRLAELDAAPRTEPSASEIDREETLLRSILRDDTKPGRTIGAAFRRPLVRRLAFTLTGALVAGATAVAALAVTTDLLDGGSGPLSSSQLASWTGTPSSLSSAGAEGDAAVKQCLDATKQSSDGDAPAKISNADIRGTVASMIVTRAGNSTLCLAGSDGSSSTMAVSAPEKVPAKEIALDTLGARGEGSGQVNHVLGWVGSDVEKIVVRDHGHTVQATIENGWWSAWWPQGDPDGLLTGTLTLTFADGTTKTLDGKAFMEAEFAKGD
ncbi:hypothetical protein SGFS_062300 [Streptomyces graminofaciens]|uniref:Uncharacterized protein n=1 Tax=Streptomyces graminofaciens TaxID=68212 RepID=A0ABM7FD21_9ACTN|nr:hypothetical protein [Streptomyces graminofaciens]BBC34936.1 hypothetical protein SGFS_062300 [Streptomyces graminofaciens]